MDIYIFVNLIGNEERKKNESNEMNETGVLFSLVRFVEFGSVTSESEIGIVITSGEPH